MAKIIEFYEQVLPNNKSKIVFNMKFFSNPKKLTCLYWCLTDCEMSIEYEMSSLQTRRYSTILKCE